MSFSPSNPPKRDGSYSRFVVKRNEPLPSAAGGIVAVPITHDWGPFKVFTYCNSLQEFTAIYGQGETLTPGYLAVYNAFKGEGRGTPGAGRVLVYRTGASGAAKSTRVLSTAAPAAAITLTARYEGTRGNKISVGVEANASNPSTQNDLFVQLNGVEVERYPHAKTNITALAADVNKRSGWVTAGSVTSGTALAPVAATALTGGNDGSTLLAQDWTNLLSAYESKRFEVFVPYDLTDNSIRTALETWAANLNAAEKSKRFMLVHGGALNESATTALSRSASADNENIVTLGIGSYHDTNLNVVQSPSQLAPRLAGVIAQRGIDAAISFAHLEDIEIVVGPTAAEASSAISDLPGQGGVVVISENSGGAYFEKGVTTRVSDTDDRPKETYGNIKYVFTMQAFERRLRERHEDGTILGRLDVNEDTREFLVSDGRTLLDEFIKVGAVQPGATVVIAADPPPTDDDTFVALDWPAKFGRYLGQVRNSFFMS